MTNFVIGILVGMQIFNLINFLLFSKENEQPNEEKPLEETLEELKKTLEEFKKDQKP